VYSHTVEIIKQVARDLGYVIAKGYKGIRAYRGTIWSVLDT
jgi:hypothetical protein